MAFWAIKLRAGDHKALLQVWTWPAVTAAAVDDYVWLRGRSDDSEWTQRLASIPCEGWYEVLPNGALREPGRLLPRGWLPQVQWRPLSELIQLELPARSLPAQRRPSLDVQIVPGQVPSEPNVLLTDLVKWKNWSSHASAVRLKRCRFAVSRDGQTVIHGSPLPPIPGERAVEKSGLTIPCGWTCAPAIAPEILAEAWRVAPGDLWLMWPGRPVERITADQFTAADHAAVYETWEAFQRDAGY